MSGVGVSRKRNHECHQQVTTFFFFPFPRQLKVTVGKITPNKKFEHATAREKISKTLTPRAIIHILRYCGDGSGSQENLIVIGC
jgi:hypothetical protein